MFLDTRAEAPRQLDRLDEALVAQTRAVRLARELEMGLLPTLEERLDALAEAKDAP